MAESVNISEAVASLIWQVASAGEPVEPALFRDWLEAYHLARLAELQKKMKTAQAALHAAADALVAARATAEERTAAEEPPAAPASPEGFESVEDKKPSPWAVKKKRIMDRLEAALKRGVTRGEIAEASGGKLGLQDIMDFVERKRKTVAEWDALSAALKNLEGVSGYACKDV